MADLATLMEKIAVPVTVAIIGGIVTFLVARLGKKGDRENAHIDQLQEDRDKDRERIDKLVARQDAQDKEIAALRAEVADMHGREVLWRSYSGTLAVQVITLGGTPHPRPEGLAS